MKFVLVDTSVWSLAFRKKRPDSHDKKLIEYLTILISNHYAIMSGPIQQESLSGISDQHIIIYVEVMAYRDHISII